MFKCFSSAKGALILGAVAVVAVYLVVWHSVHVAAATPFLLLLACPLMHLFVYGSHGHHHSRSASPHDNKED